MSPRFCLFAIALCVAVPSFGQSGTGPVPRVTGRVPFEPSSCGVGGFVQGLPPNFFSEEIPGPWSQAIGVTFDELGRMYVWENGGIVHLVEDGVPASEPLIDIRAEVGNWGNHGLRGFALDPDFYSNGYIYLLYTVDRHHLLHFGTGSYDPEADDYFSNTISRLTRYTATAASGRRVVDEASRQILIGTTSSDGFSVCGVHTGGSLLFFHDGSLALSYGDNGNEGYGGVSCLSEGIFAPKEDIAAMRAQLLDGMNGKILRLDPATGDGMADNPFFQPADPSSPRSRVWSLGLRNPFRMVLMPEHEHDGEATGTLGADRADATVRTADDAKRLGDHPGTLIVGDVGAAHFEEINIAAGGENFGWPFYEGSKVHEGTWSNPIENLDAPNPLFGVGGCTLEFFHFQDLLVEDSLNTPSWLNPCDRDQPVPVAIPTFVHERPVLTWGHAGPAAVPIYDGAGEADWVTLGEPGAPVLGASFAGNSSIGGAWYDGLAFPAKYHETYFHADFGAQTIFNLSFDASHQLAAVEPFALTAGPVVSMDVDPLSGDLYYVLFEHASSTVVRIAYSLENLPPVAQIDPSVVYGPVPWSVDFIGTNSSDPEGSPLLYEWTFGDGSRARTSATAVHVFPSRDVTNVGVFTTKLDELVPPTPMGAGSLDPEVIRDGIFPLTGVFLPLLQFDTWHFDAATLLSDKGREDWYGYLFAAPQLFTEIFLQEGVRWENGAGGWFETPPLVQVLDANGLWNSVTGQVFDPAYPALTDPGGEIDFLRFHIDFDPAPGYGIRIFGQPGGFWEFVGCGELRVMAWDPSVVTPTNYLVQLKVTDDGGNDACTTQVISVNNTPPEVTITSLVDGAPVVVKPVPAVLPFEGVVADAEHDSELFCTWQTILVHDNHEHPGPLIASCETIGTFIEHLTDPDDVVYYTVELTATDPLGLSTTDTVHLYPAHDCNFNGIDDAQDILSGTSLDLNGNLVPDECELDCNMNGVHDLFDIVLGYSADIDQNEIPDECQ